jgi:Zn-dependent alcohol dehydrogenase
MTAYHPGVEPSTVVPKIVDWYMEGKINIDDLITHEMPGERINEAFDLMHDGKSIRSWSQNFACIPTFPRKCNGWPTPIFG